MYLYNVVGFHVVGYLGFFPPYYINLYINVGLGKVAMNFFFHRYHYTCVIYGWDKEGRISEEWITQEGVGNLHGRPFQPFYNVLAEDGSNRYAAQGQCLFGNFTEGTD